MLTTCFARCVLFFVFTVWYRQRILVWSSFVWDKIYLRSLDRWCVSAVEKIRLPFGLLLTGERYNSSRYYRTSFLSSRRSEGCFDKVVQWIKPSTYLHGLAGNIAGCIDSDKSCNSPLSLSLSVADKVGRWQIQHMARSINCVSECVCVCVCVCVCGGGGWEEGTLEQPRITLT